MYFDYAQCKQKGFAPILVLVGILVIAMVAGGAYYYASNKLVYFGKSQVIKPQVQNQVISQTPHPVSSVQPALISDEITNWKTYTGKNYTFKYPETWVIKQSIDVNREDDGLDIYITSPDYVPDPNYENPHEGGDIVGVKKGFRLEIRTAKNPKLRTYEDWKEFHESTATKNWYGRIFNKKEEISIKGIKAMFYTEGKPDGLGILSASFFVENGRIYDVALISSQNQDDLFRQILSTFRFLDQNQTVGTSNWKTYTSDLVNFSIKYPATMSFYYDDRLNEARIGGQIYISSSDKDPTLGCKEDCPISSKKEDVTINNIQMIKVEEDRGALGGSEPATLHYSKYIIPNPKGGSFIIITHLPWNPSASPTINESMFDKIVSTFKFD